MCWFLVNTEGAFDVAHGTVCDLVAKFLQHVDDKAKATHPPLPHLGVAK